MTTATLAAFQLSGILVYTSPSLIVLAPFLHEEAHHQVILPHLQHHQEHLLVVFPMHHIWIAISLFQEQIAAAALHSLLEIHQAGE